MSEFNDMTTAKQTLRKFYVVLLWPLSVMGCAGQGIESYQVGNINVTIRDTVHLEDVSADDEDGKLVLSGRFHDSRQLHGPQPEKHISVRVSDTRGALVEEAKVDLFGDRGDFRYELETETRLIGAIMVDYNATILQHAVSDD